MAYIDIQKRIKRRRRRFKVVFFLIVISLATMFLFKTPVFKVRNIVVNGNSVVFEEELVELSGVNIGDNLLKLNIRQINENILVNPYIETSKIRRTILGSVYITVSERKAAGIASFRNKYATFDKKGVIIELIDSMEGMNLPLIQGLEIQNALPGKTMEILNKRKLDAFSIIINNISNSGLSDIINEIDLNNLVSVVLKTVHGISIKIGTIENIGRKLAASKAIIEQDILKKGIKGTLDLSFNGNPVFRQE